MPIRVDYERLIAADHEAIARLESPEQKALSALLDDAEGRAYARVWDFLMFDRTAGVPRTEGAIRWISELLGLTPQDVSDWAAAIEADPPKGFPRPNLGPNGYEIERRMESLELRSEAGRRDSLRLARAVLAQHQHYRQKFG